MGISPPAWGSRKLVDYTDISERYIPTCVGQPSLPGHDEPQGTVYPHLRGAAYAKATLVPKQQGISPLAWGSRFSRVLCPIRSRYIPTCVGQPGYIVREHSTNGVYPHLRGAARVVVCVRSCRRGISPLAWGSLKLRSDELMGLGYIPTCVGQPVK